MYYEAPSRFTQFTVQHSCNLFFVGFRHLGSVGLGRFFGLHVVLNPLSYTLNCQAASLNAQAEIIESYLHSTGLELNFRKAYVTLNT